MKAILKKTFVGGIALGAVAAFAFLVGNGCNGNRSSEMGPAEVVEAFNRAVTAGDFDMASELCDTVAMKDYLESYKEAWDTLNAEDSTILSIASSILEKAVIEVEDVKKEGDKRVVLYSLEADGHSKTRKAVVRKEEGAWRVEMISDAQ
ncbi:MAG: DUF4878 domain-containing protein, partial [Bacteroidales bacterium]|nr:DUF4878 domain-containing protein [Bacteroidales bacterium]